MQKIKSIEIFVRRLLIRALKLVVRRGKALPSGIDFNRCKILFLRPDRIGDVLISTPVFSSLKEHYPNARLDILLGMKNSFMLENDPLLCKRWIYRKKNIGAIIAVLLSIRKEKYDFTVDMMDNPSATGTLLCLLAGARWNIGLVKENSYVYDIAVPRPSRKDAHIVDRTAQLLVAFGIEPGNEKLRIRYSITPEEEAFANQFLIDNHLMHRTLIGINISAGAPARFWGIDNFRKLVSTIAEKHPQLRSLVLFKPDDMQRAHAIAASNRNVWLSPITTTFNQFAALLKKTSLLVSPDTSAIHLASAFGIPSIILVHKDQRIWEPYNVAYEALVTEINDLATIPFDAVASALDRMLKQLKQVIAFDDTEKVR
jgi:ADP-heptose:LPS heptosyltransferase